MRVPRVYKCFCSLVYLCLLRTTFNLIIYTTHIKLYKLMNILNSSSKKERLFYKAIKYFYNGNNDIISQKI